MVGDYLDNKFVQFEKQLTGLDISVFFVEENNLYSTFIKDKTFFNKRIKNIVKNKSVVETIELNNLKYKIRLSGIYQNDGSVIGIICVGKLLNDITKYHKHLVKLLLTVIITGIVLSIIIVALISKNFSQPIEQLVNKMKLIGKGNFGIYIKQKRNDEIGILEKNFNNMSAELENLTLKLKQTQQELIQNEKLAVAGKLTEELAHEIRNPLNSLSANLELLKKYFVNSDKEKGLNKIKILKNEIYNLNLKLTKFLQTAAPLSINVKYDNIISTIKNAVELIKYELKNNNIKLNLNYDESELYMFHDIESIKSVMINLIKNCIESFKTNNKIIEIKIEKINNNIIILVKDNGIGMSFDTQKRIFEPYFTTKNNGTGLGLIFVKKVVDAHNGKIKVESCVDEGTEFKIILPVLKKSNNYNGKT
jgi:signal transduction histidine kinase